MDSITNYDLRKASAQTLTIFNIFVLSGRRFYEYLYYVLAFYRSCCQSFDNVFLQEEIYYEKREYDKRYGGCH